MNVEIKTDRFFVRNLKVVDVGENYLSWFQDVNTARFITAAPLMAEIEKLKKYVMEKSSQENVLFLGIFFNGEHIGNIKFEPIDREKKFTIFGVLIGSTDWRGKGVVGEVLTAIIPILQKIGIVDISLAVDLDNTPAFKAYEKLGFKIMDKYLFELDKSKSIEMVLKISC